MFARIVPVLAVSFAASALIQPASAQTYTFKKIDIVKSDETILRDIAKFTILGWDLPATGIPTCYMINGTSKTAIADPLGEVTYCYGINNADTIVGYYEHGDNIAVGFTYSLGVYSDFSLPNGAPSPIPLGTSDHGAICGYYYDINANPVGFVLRSGVVHLIKVPGALNIFPIDINNRNDVTLQVIDGAGNPHAYLRHGITMTELIYPGATLTIADKLNNQGQIAGTYTDQSAVRHGFVYDSATATYYTIDDPGKSETSLNAINDQQTLVGDFRNNPGASREGLKAVGSLP